MVHALMPLAVLTMLSVMENIDRNLPRAASTLGARPGTAFWKIYFPLSFPGVAAAGIMVFVTAIGFFIVPALLGGRRETMITEISSPGSANAELGLCRRNLSAAADRSDGGVRDLRQGAWAFDDDRLARSG